MIKQNQLHAIVELLHGIDLAHAWLPILIIIHARRACSSSDLCDQIVVD